MANLQKFRAHEALNTTAAGGYNQLDASSGGLGGSSGAVITAAVSGGSTSHLDLSVGAHQLLIYASGDIYFHFATSDTAVDTDIALILPGGSLTSIAIPVAIRSHGSSDTIRFSFLSTSASATRAVRIVEV